LAKASVNKKTSGKLVMTVDDEPDIRSTIKTVLETAGFEVATAVNGDDCLAKLAKLAKEGRKPNLILMDIMMPGTPVREVLQKIDGIDVVYLSVVRISEAEKEDLLKQKNVVGFIQKPFDIDDLVKRVKNILA
jgi:CheY-like chemotaxis protein